MANEYSNLARLRQYIQLDSLASANTEDDALLFRLLNRASRAIDTYTRRKFYPTSETQFYDYVESRQVKFGDDLVSLTAVKYLNGACTMGSGVMWMAAGRDWNRRPADRLILNKSSGSVFNFTGTPQRAVEIDGVWGYHENWNDAWVDTGACLSASYAASGLSLSLAGAGSAGSGASDILGDYPRIAVGDLVKIDNEWMQVTGGAASGNGTVVVKPYANGTTAASHASGASITRFHPEPDIEWCALRLASWRFGQRAQPYTEKLGNAALGTYLTPIDMPPDVKDALDRFVRRSIETFSVDTIF